MVHSAARAIFILTILLGCHGCSDSSDINDTDRIEPLWGVSFDGTNERLVTDAQIAQMQELGVHYAKFWLIWIDIEPQLASYNARLDEFGVPGEGQPTDLTRDLLAENPDWIEEYAFPERPGSRFHELVDWSYLDAQVDKLVSAGISPLPWIADAPRAPKVPTPEGPATITPEPLDYLEQGHTGIGREAYLAHVKLHAAGAARRYSQSPERITWWNIENELNITFAHLALGWRTGEAWLDDSFRAEALAALSGGLKIGSPNARATHNVNACLFDQNWNEDLANWAEYVDALGLGCYPNYFSAEPVQAKMLTDAVAVAAALGQTLDKPVFVLETGYASAPASGGWSEELQAEYIAISSAGSMDAGASMYIYFQLNDRDWDFPEGEINQVENHWGLVRLNGTYKPGFTAFKDVITNYAGQP
jgi:hypothetical protein